MKKLILLALIIFTFSYTFASQYEFDESYTLINDEYSFITSFRENTELDMMDLNLGMSYAQRDQYDAFKADMKVTFKFWDYGRPFAFMAYDDLLDYKRIGAGYERDLMSVYNRYGYKVFNHTMSIGAAYDSSQDYATWIVRYNSKFSLPYNQESMREMLSCVANVYVNNFGEKYVIGSEYRFNEELSLYGQYESERVSNKTDSIIKQGIRIRI